MPRKRRELLFLVFLTGIIASLIQGRNRWYGPGSPSVYNRRKRPMQGSHTSLSRGKSRRGLLVVGQWGVDAVIGRGGVVMFEDGTTLAHRDGKGTNALFETPVALAVTHSGDVIVADTENNAIRSIDKNGVTRTFAGMWSVSGDGIANQGHRRLSALSNPQGVAVATDQKYVYFSDTKANCVRKISPNGMITLLAGCWYSEVLDDMDYPLHGDANDDAKPPSPLTIQDGVGAKARFYRPSAMSIDPSSGSVYVLSEGGTRIRRVSPHGNVTTIYPSATTVATTPTTAAITATSAATTATTRLRSSIAETTWRPKAWSSLGYLGYRGPGGIALDPDGNVYFSGAERKCIKKLEVAEARVSTFAGNGESGACDGQGTSAKFSLINGLHWTRNGILYVCDSGNGRLRSVSRDGIVSTLEIVKEQVEGEGVGADKVQFDYEGDHAEGFPVLQDLPRNEHHPSCAIDVGSPLVYPVGVITSPDGGTLFVADPIARSVLRCRRKIRSQKLGSHSSNASQTQSNPNGLNPDAVDQHDDNSDDTNDSDVATTGSKEYEWKEEQMVKDSGQWKIPILQNKRTVKAIFTFQNRTKHEIPFKMNDIILVFRKSSSKDYLIGTVVPAHVKDADAYRPDNTSCTGLVPTCYVTGIMNLIWFSPQPGKRSMQANPLFNVLRRFLLHRCSSMITSRFDCTLDQREAQVMPCGGHVCV